MRVVRNIFFFTLNPTFDVIGRNYRKKKKYSKLKLIKIKIKK